MFPPRGLLAGPPALSHLQTFVPVVRTGFRGSGSQLSPPLLSGRQPLQLPTLPHSPGKALLAAAVSVRVRVRVCSRHSECLLTWRPCCRPGQGRRRRGLGLWGRPLCQPGIQSERLLCLSVLCSKETSVLAWKPLLAPPRLLTAEALGGGGHGSSCGTQWGFPLGLVWVGPALEGRLVRQESREGISILKKRNPTFQGCMGWSNPGPQLGS